MKEYKIRITKEDLEKTRSVLMADMPKESASFLLTGIRKGADGAEFIVRRLVEIPSSEYRIQNKCHMDISPRAINGIISLCEKNGLGLILCHSHSMDTPYSESDYFGEGRVARSLWDFLPDIPVGSLLFTPSGYYGRVWEQSGSVENIATINVVGRNLSKITLEKKEFNYDHPDAQVYDRQILAFGKRGQRIISGTKVGIVGLGGTGSPTAEQLVRLGVKDFVLIDKDVFDKSNLTRLYGSIYNDSAPFWFSPMRWYGKKSKVDLVEKHLKRIKPGIKIKKIKDNVVVQKVCEALLDRDIIFSCTDDHWGRSIINQLAYQYLIPVINMGVRVDSKDGTIQGASGSIHILRPSKPCLWCYGYLNAKRIRAESLPSSERDSLLREGYIEDLDEPAPSVIPLTTTVSGHAVTLFLQLMTDYMGEAGDLSSLRYDIMEGVVRRGTTHRGSQCICQLVKGYGDLKSLPTI